MADLNHISLGDLTSLLGHRSVVNDRPARLTGCGTAPPFLQNTAPALLTASLSVSQEFADFPTFSSVTLDDFTTPAGGLVSICNVELTMSWTQTVTAATTFRIRIYDSNPVNFPSLGSYGTPLCQEDVVVTVNRVIFGCVTTDVPLTGACSTLVLAPGTTYYYGAQTVMPLVPDGQSFYCRSSDPGTVGAASVFYNPGNGFALGGSTSTPLQNVDFALEFSFVAPLATE